MVKTSPPITLTTISCTSARHCSNRTWCTPTCPGYLSRRGDKLGSGVLVSCRVVRCITIRCRSLPNLATSSRLSASLTSLTAGRLDELQHLSEGSSSPWYGRSGTVHAPPGRTDAVLLSLGMGVSFAIQFHGTRPLAETFSRPPAHTAASARAAGCGSASAIWRRATYSGVPAQGPAG
jgi:hypothetical protein